MVYTLVSVFSRGAVALRRHRIAHAALACTYGAISVLLMIERAFGHAVCTAVAALVYGALCQPPAATEAGPDAAPHDGHG